MGELDCMILRYTMLMYMRKFVFWVTIFFPWPVFALTNFPSNVDTPAGLGIAVPGQPILSAHHNNVTDAVIAVQTKVGKNNSSDPTSIDYLLKNTGSVDPGHKHTGSSLTNIDATTITVGTLSDARLSSNIARLNIANTWTALQTFSSGISANSITVSGTVTASTFSGSGSGLTNIPETAITNGALLARVADNETITGNWTFTGTLTASGANITGILESNIVDGALLARVADNETITGTWSFSDNIAQIRGVPYTWPAANAAGFLSNDGAGNLGWVATVASPAAGASKEIQFNTSGSLDADFYFVWDKTLQRLGVGTNTPLHKVDVAGGNIRTDQQFISTIFTGTAPLSVDSTTKVTNLNVDLFDDFDSVDFPRKAENATITGDWTFTGTLTASGANITGILESNIVNGTILARVADNETITGTWSFSDNIAQIRGVSYTWPAANAAGVLTNNGTGTLSWSSSPAIAAGSTGHIQFNNGGVLAGESNLFWDATNDRLGVRTATPGQAIDVVGGNIRTNQQFISTISTGTAPLSVASTTKVTNLNVDLFDDYDSVHFPRKAENATITGAWTYNNFIVLNSGFNQFMSGTNVFLYAFVNDTTIGSSDPYEQHRWTTFDVVGPVTNFTLYSLNVSGEPANSWVLNIRLTGYQYAPSISSHYIECTALYTYDGTTLTLNAYSCPVNLLSGGVGVYLVASAPANMVVRVTQPSGVNIRWLSIQRTLKGVA